jgi:hypothetical protein
MTDKPKKLQNTARPLLIAATVRADHIIALPKLPVAAARQVDRSLLNAGFAGTVQRLGESLDQAASASANDKDGWEIGSNTWPNPEPSAPL